MDINFHSKNINLHSTALYIEISAFSYYPPAVKKKRKKEKRDRKKGQEKMTIIIKKNLKIKAEHFAPPLQRCSVHQALNCYRCLGFHQSGG